MKCAFLLEHWFLAISHLSLKGHLAMSGDSFGYQRDGVGAGEMFIGILEVETSNAAKHPVVHKTPHSQRL